MFHPKSPVKNGGVLFQALSSQESAFDHDHELGVLGSAPEGSYDPYAPHVPLLPNRRSGHGQQPRPISLSGSTYREFDTQRLYAASSDGKRDPFNPSPAASETDFLKTPLSALFPSGVPKPPPQHPFASGYEAPEWAYILIHAAFCALAYPVLLVFVVLANHRTIFWSRLVVGMGCGAVGVALAASLSRLGQRYLEAATWATLIHQSRAPNNPGIRMRDFADGSQYPTSALSALRLLWNRIFLRGTARSARKHYDSRPWSLAVLFFLLLASIEHQWERYYEVAIAADSSDSDIQRATALDPAFNDFTLTWTLSPFSSHGALPPAISFQWGNETVYFSETARSQLLTNGSGLRTSPNRRPTELGKAVDAGVLLRYPRWGIRIHCTKFSDPNTIIPRSAAGFTYLFTPRDILRSLFSSFEMDFPSVLEAPLNLTTTMQPNDTFPSGLNASDIALAALFFDNGVAHSFKSVPTSMGGDGNGFVSIETLLVRLNTTYTPNGKFLTHSDLAVPDVTGQDTFIGMDAAVCLELYEPWVLETYDNSVGVPTSLRIVNKGNTVVDANTTDFQEVNIAPPLTDPTLKRHLNSTNLFNVYDVAHGNSANQILKDNGRDAFYVPSPTLVSFTGGQGPKGYLELSASNFEQARALADASNVLTYFAGSGQTVARCYTDDVLAETKINNFQAVIVIVTILILGLAAGLFVPRLPMSVPRRGFELYSWMAVLYSHELVLDQIDHDGLAKRMELRDIENRLGDLRFRYGF
ncbi:hypothetical protein MVEN_02421000 [Mycena venus]|uniref:Uncharacterized protein n=1 Tax=Mycena venus TaxID=2733690 RepID=A0A8H6WY56_9AGAR|nr:hypothetical protein MVEN_02421000 [Mycena venus]